MTEWIVRLEWWRSVLGSVIVVAPSLIMLLDVQFERAEAAMYFGMWVQVNLSLLLD